MIQNIFLDKWLGNFSIICIRANYVSIVTDLSLCNFTSFCDEEGKEDTNSVIGKWCIRLKYKFAFNNYMDKVKKSIRILPFGM
jgi:hypothetical protein